MARAHAHSFKVMWDAFSSLPPLHRGVKLGLLRVGVSTPSAPPTRYRLVTARSLPPFGMIDRVGAVAQLLGDMRSHTRTETVCIQSVPDSRRSKGCLLRCARTSPSLNADDVQPVRTPPVASLRANHAEGYPATPALRETRVALMDEGCEQCMSSLPLLTSHTPLTTITLCSKMTDEALRAVRNCLAQSRGVHSSTERPSLVLNFLPSARLQSHSVSHILLRCTTRRC
jgi:hypothetical protein